MWSSAQLPVVAVIVGVSALVMMVRMAALYYSCFILFGFLPHPFRSKKTWRVYDDIVDNTLSRMSHDLELLTELERVLSRKQERTGVKKYNLSLLQLEIKITQARLARVQRIAEQCGYVVRESKAESMPQVG